MTVLMPMRDAAFSGYLDHAVAAYAAENVVSGRWPAASAQARSRAEFLALLPLGLATPGQHLYEILASASGPAVGIVWFAVEERHGSRGAFVYDVEIWPEHRRQGHARAAFLALEPIVAGLGLTSIGLHVFSHNVGAQALYRALGYAPTGINMLKRVDTSSAPPGGS